MDLVKLLAVLESAAQGLPAVQKKRMFGCDALFTNGAIFALLWKKGRIGLKLWDDARYEELMGMPGAAPWKAGPMVMAHWVLVPEALHADPAALRAWVKRAHGMARSGDVKAKPAAKKAAAKKPAAKTKAVAKKAAAKKPLAKKAAASRK